MAGNPNHDQQGRFSSGGGSGQTSTGVTRAARERAAINKQTDLRHIQSPNPARPVVARHANEPSVNTDGNAAPHWNAIKQAVKDTNAANRSGWRK
ncbi:MAG: hypothetical protein ABSC37_03095 [Xanthobacteraceae bacterium]